MAKEDFLDYPEFIEEAQKINQIALNPSRSTSGPASWTNPRTSATYSVASGGDLALAKKIRDDRAIVFGVLDVIEDIEAIETALLTKQNIEAKTTLLRPTTPITGQMVFDTTLGIPIWWNGTFWVDALGADADY